MGRRRGKGELLAGQGGCLVRPQTHRPPADSKRGRGAFLFGRRRARFHAGLTGVPRAWQATISAEQTFPALKPFCHSRLQLPALPWSRNSGGRPSAMKGWGPGVPSCPKKRSERLWRRRLYGPVPGRLAAGFLLVSAIERLANATICRFCGCFCRKWTVCQAVRTGMPRLSRAGGQLAHGAFH